MRHERRELVAVDGGPMAKMEVGSARPFVETLDAEEAPIDLSRDDE